MPKVRDAEKVGHSRPPLERMLRIHQSIQSGDYPSVPVLAEQLEVSQKTIHRDLEFMRDRLQLPLEFDRLRVGWHYTQEVSAFPTMQITEGELFALVVAEKALQQYRGTSFEQPLLSALKKMQKALPETISVDLAELERTISFTTRVEPLLDLAVFDKLTKATANRQQLELCYRKPGQRQPETRIVDPYHLANINGEWFLFAFDHLRRDIRTFVPARIKTLKTTGKSFPKPRQFSLEERLRDSFGVHSGKGRFDVVIRFNEHVADYIREKKWHDSQQLRELKNGGLQLQLELSSLGEVERWVLSWGGNATVIRPRVLADSVRSAAKKLLKGTSPTAAGK
jgi:predicted DNA-binding transcriptional regulator YafY